ncbi:hypothetical protein BKH46_08380 [Helicobacter sp. 12S02634-8]|uniref:endonuclease n=1 Tax=Helicobacter sp. 12S02634-8 TaxID=1476199 RepID=UPI000BC3F7F7|nr:endonuclease [Helicobacter sp. 12S02634-8]PAF46247.1 hypothetical protein BKH46_08380 [Helicobacter sp. 12S02634-8]
MKKFFLVLLLGFMGTSGLVLNAKAIDSFEKAKKVLPTIFANHQTTFYCGCPYYKEGGKLLVGDCPDYTPRNAFTKTGKVNERAKRIEWEHIMPAENFGRGLTCWRDGDAQCVDSKGKSFKGRSCCKKVSEKFRKMEADLRNLVPTIGEVNADRSNFRYAQATKNAPMTQYGKCKFEVDFKLKRAYPRDAIKGMIARTYFYMSKTYGVALSDQEKKLMMAWDKTYPMTQSEKDWIKRIQAFQ